MSSYASIVRMSAPPKGTDAPNGVAEKKWNEDSISEQLRLKAKM